jgi:hypothetical protein
MHVFQIRRYVRDVDIFKILPNGKAGDATKQLNMEANRTVYRHVLEDTSHRIRPKIDAGDFFLLMGSIN